ncbi:MAG: hypothetical protein GZ088_01660 [Acidipila sp.]|nr:hypothetical protein [Acidipila sp.]
MISHVQSAIAQGTIAPAINSPDPAGSFTWEDQFSSQGHEFRNTFQTGGVTHVFASGHGSPGFMSNGKVKRFTPHVALAELPFHLPAILLAMELANTNYNITLVGPASVNGQPAIQVHLTIDTDPLNSTLGVQEWFFDPVSGLPLRVEYRLPDTFDAREFMKAALDFSNFQIVQGLVVPFTMTAYERGTPRTIATISSLTLNPSVSPGDFDLPTGGVQ